jgi:hypothetical protein
MREQVVLALDSQGWRNPKLPSSAYEQVRELLQQEPRPTNTEIARRVGCSATTVFRHRRRLDGSPAKKGPDALAASAMEMVSLTPSEERGWQSE